MKHIDDPERDDIEQLADRTESSILISLRSALKEAVSFEFSHGESVSFPLKDTGVELFIEWQNRHDRHLVWIENNGTPQQVFRELVFVVRYVNGETAARLAFQEDPENPGWHFPSAGGRYTLELCER